jgi:two-component system CheB/CheR fusion protein
MPDADANACILLVDDDESIVAAMRMLLRVSGHRVQSADSAAAALALVEAGVRPHALVVDFQLGVDGPDGIELLRALRAKLGRDVPAIVTTGDVSGELEPVVASLPACSLLVKPFDPQAFVARIEALPGGA